MKTVSENRPVLRIVRGDATAEEIAALLAVVAARTGGASARRPRPRAASAWNDRSRLTRQPLHPGPGAWQASGWAR